MSSSPPPQPPYPQQPPFPPQPPYRRLERSRHDRVFGGVCAGIADYARLDPALVRVLTVVATLFTGVPLIAYLIALVVMPEAEDAGRPQGYPPVRGGGYSPYPQDPRHDSTPRQYDGGVSPDDQAVWGPGGAPWHQGPERPRQYGPQDRDPRS